MDASFEGFTNEQIEEYKRCARLVHAAFSSVEPVSGGYRLILDSSEELQMEDLESFAILEQKAIFDFQFQTERTLCWHNAVICNSGGVCDSLTAID